LYGWKQTHDGVLSANVINFDTFEKIRKRIVLLWRGDDDAMMEASGMPSIFSEICAEMLNSQTSFAAN